MESTKKDHHTFGCWLIECFTILFIGYPTDVHLVTQLL